VRSGLRHNVIPSTGELSGTLRMLDVAAWHESEQLVRTLIRELVAPYGVTTEVTYVRGVPPVVNSVAGSALLRSAVVDVLGKEAPTGTSQSLGGEDFAWFLESVRGPWVAWAPARRAVAPSTCTRAACESMTGPSSSARRCWRRCDAGARGARNDTEITNPYQ
jgi:metal-dependent amidase/aminoacylase/carboxypeptidase family protein